VRALRAWLDAAGATDPDGHSVELSDHEGYVAQVFDDGTEHGGGPMAEVDRHTVASGPRARVAGKAPPS
jgi:hypothetical protein